MNRLITIYEVFELNRILHSILEQQSSYNIKTAFKIHTLIKWLDDTEKFIFERMNAMSIDLKDETQKAFLLTQIPFIDTKLKCSDLLDTTGVVKLDVNDVEMLEKMLDKTED